MNILVTGANGLVGRALVSRLRADGYAVHAAVRKSTGDVNEYPIGDMGPETDWTHAVRGCQVVVHLASRVHLMQDRSQNPLQEYRHVNVAGTQSLARQAARAGVKRFIFASSIKVNGEGRVAPYRETDPPSPQDAYAVSKWEAEQELLNLGRTTGMEIVILRIPLVYGPGVRANFLSLIRLVDLGIPLPFGNITNQRSLIYLGNLVDALATCVRHERAANHTFMVSDGKPVSTPDLIRRLAAALHKSPRLWPLPYAWLRIAVRLTGKEKYLDRLLGSLHVDTTAIQQTLNWSPPHTMQEGLEDTVTWYRHFKNSRHD